MSAQQEYRIDELARAAGVKVRNLRYYQERGLLPPPRREGRIAWYSQDHLARLRVIAELLARGHTLNGIGELLTAWEQGSGVADVLGLERVLTEPWSEDEEVVLPYEEMAALFGDEATEENLSEAIALGYLQIEGETVTHHSRRLLEGTVALVQAGVPLRAVLAAGRRLKEHMDETASLFVALARDHVLSGLGTQPLPPDEIHRLAKAVEELRQVGRDVAMAEFARAMERRVRTEFGEALGNLTAAAPRSDAPTPPAGTGT